MVQTTTKGILHFEDLEPKMFEKMYLDILVASKKYEDIRWYGLGGSDGGIDIKFTSIEDGLKYFAQCKRYKALSASGLKKIVDRIIKDAIDYKGQILWVISSCEISKKTYDSFEQYAIEKGVKKAYYKGRGILDSEKVQKWVAKRGILILAILYVVDNQVRLFAKTVHFGTGR